MAFREIFKTHRETWRSARKPGDSRVNRETWQLCNTSVLTEFLIIKMRIFSLQTTRVSKYGARKNSCGFHFTKTKIIDVRDFATDTVLDNKSKNTNQKLN